MLDKTKLSTSTPRARCYGRMLIPFAALTMAGACSIQGPRADPEPAEEERRPEAIIGGSEAVNYPEAVLIDMSQNGWPASSCSGSLIAPRIVLTAGHCVAGFDGWAVKAPYAGGAQSATSNQAATFDWNDTSGSVNPYQHDVAVIILSTPITIGSYPAIADSPIDVGAQLVNVGRIDNGYFSNSQLFVSQPLSVSDGNNYGYPYDYVAAAVIQPGDSGGPDLLPGPAPHTIVAVNSGGGGGIELLARVDLVHGWIMQQIADNGGGADPTPSPDPDPGPDPDPPPSPDPDPTNCIHDVCTEAGPLVASCDPCAASVCAIDPYCCSTSWDLKCISEVDQVCGGSCSDNGPSAPADDPPPGNDPDPCGGLTYTGECQGGEVWWCENGQIYVTDCASGGMSCVWKTAQQYYGCG